MTTEECKRPFAMLHANWPFLDFSDETTALIWFEAFRPYMEPEVRQGISDAIANITIRSAPTVGEIMEYIRNVHDGFRRLEKEEEAKGSGSDSVSCQLCNDYGWQTIIYPSGYEAVRACSCSAAMKAFGEKALKRQAEDKPKWFDRQMFGENEIPGQYELVRVSRTPVPTGEKYKDSQGNLQERMTWGWTPYFPRQGREEVFLQYQKRRRKV